MRIIILFSFLLFTEIVHSQSFCWKFLGDSIVANYANEVQITTSRDGIPYLCFGPNLTVMKFESGAWEQVGFLTEYPYCEPKIFFDTNNVLYIIYLNSDYDLVTKYFDGNYWLTLCPPIHESTPALSVKVSLNGEFFLATNPDQYGSKATVRKYDGTQWVLLGPPGFSEEDVSDLSLDIGPDNIPFVSFTDLHYSEKLSVMKFNGTFWEYVGNPGEASIGKAEYSSIKINQSGIPYIAYTDFSDYKGRVIYYDGSSWNLLTQPYSEDFSIYNELLFNEDDQPIVCFQDWANMRKVSVVKYENNSWIYQGDPGFSPDSTYANSMAIDNNGHVYVAFIDTHMKLSVMKYDTLYTTINEVNQDDFLIYPNPCNETFIVDIKERPDSKNEIEIINLQGEKVKEFQMVTKSAKFDVSNLVSGMYFIKINNLRVVKLIKAF